MIRSNPPARQHLRELDWDGPMLLSPVAFLAVQLCTNWLSASRVVPLSARSVAWCFVGHYLVVEPIYYYFHRWLHLPSIYHASHSHHHASTTTEAISGTSHPFWETVGYLANFSFPFLVPAWVGCFSCTPSHLASRKKPVRAHDRCRATSRTVTPSERVRRSSYVHERAAGCERD